MVTVAVHIVTKKNNQESLIPLLQIMAITTIITLLKLMMLLYHSKFLREEKSTDGVIFKTLTFLCLVEFA